MYDSAQQKTFSVRGLEPRRFIISYSIVPGKALKPATGYKLVNAYRIKCNYK
jgi:hypothetical protein